jgi:hypothetical protein
MMIKTKIDLNNITFVAPLIIISSLLFNNEIVNSYGQYKYSLNNVYIYSMVCGYLTLCIENFLLENFRVQKFTDKFLKNQFTIPFIMFIIYSVLHFVDISLTIGIYSLMIATFESILYSKPMLLILASKIGIIVEMAINLTLIINLFFGKYNIFLTENLKEESSEEESNEEESSEEESGEEESNDETTKYESNDESNDETIQEIMEQNKNVTEEVVEYITEEDTKNNSENNTATSIREHSESTDSVEDDLNIPYDMPKNMVSFWFNNMSANEYFTKKYPHFGKTSMVTKSAVMKVLLDYIKYNKLHIINSQNIRLITLDDPLSELFSDKLPHNGKGVVNSDEFIDFVNGLFNHD